MQLRALTAFGLALPFLLATQQRPSSQPQAPIGGSGQKPDTTIGPDFRFETVSIKKSGPGVPSVLSWPPDGVRFHNLPLKLFLLLAYQPQAGFAQYTNQLLQNIPPWLEEHYDIDAKVAPEDIPRWRNELKTGEMHRLALRHLLQDRCKLEVHFVPVIIDGYALQVASPEKLIPHKEGTTLPKNPILLQDGEITTGIPNPDHPEMKYFNTTMEVLAGSLSHSRTLFVNETGLSGHYDFSIWKIESENPALPPPDIPWDFRTAGLKVVPRKIPSQTVYIDHIERPDPN